jgi:hypothetical protein
MPMSAAYTGNPVCQQPTYRMALTAALPQLLKLDGRPVNPIEAMQYLAALHLHAFQPTQPPPPQLLLTHSCRDVGPASLTDSPLRCLGPAGANSSAMAPTLLQHPQQATQPTAISPTPFQQIQDLLAAGRAQTGEPGSLTGYSRGPGVPLTATQQQHPEMQRRQQQAPAPGMETLRADAEAEMQLAHLLEASPQLLGPLVKVLCSAEEGSPSGLGQQQQPAALQQPHSQASMPAAVPAPQLLAEPGSAEHPCGHHPAVAGSTSPASRHLTTSWAQTEPDGETAEQLRGRIARLQDEVEALTAEVEVLSQAAAQAQKEAAVAVRQAERQAQESQQQAEAAMQRACQELATAQVR